MSDSGNPTDVHPIKPLEYARDLLLVVRVLHNVNLLLLDLRPVVPEGARENYSRVQAELTDTMDTLIKRLDKRITDHV